MQTTSSAALEAPGMLLYNMKDSVTNVAVSCPQCVYESNKPPENCANGVRLKSETIVFDFAKPVGGFSIDTEDGKYTAVRVNGEQWLNFGQIGLSGTNSCSTHVWLTVTGCSISKIEIGKDPGHIFFGEVRMIDLPPTPTPPTPTPPTPTPPTPSPTPAPTPETAPTLTPTPAPTEITSIAGGLCPHEVVVAGGDPIEIKMQTNLYVSDTCPCPEGEEITDPADCAAAACFFHLGWNVMKADNQWPHHVKGCTKRTGPIDFGFWFNKDPTGACDAHGWVKPVCKVGR